MADIPEKITMVTEQNMAICLTGIQKDVQYIKEKLDNAVVDHETRIRTLEQTTEDCKQLEQFSGIQNTLNDHEVRINSLEDINSRLEGQKQAFMSTREMIGWGLTTFLAIVAVYQFIAGK